MQTYFKKNSIIRYLIFFGMLKSLVNQTQGKE